MCFSQADPCCFFSSHFLGQTNGQLEPCIVCNGLYICRVSYFNHCHGSRNWCFKIKLKLESGYRVCMRKHIWIWGEKVLRSCIWPAMWLVLQSRLWVGVTSASTPFKTCSQMISLVEVDIRDVEFEEVFHNSAMINDSSLKINETQMMYWVLMRWIYNHSVKCHKRSVVIIRYS